MRRLKFKAKINIMILKDFKKVKDQMKVNNNIIIKQVQMVMIIMKKIKKALM